MCTQTQSHTHWRAGTRECKIIVDGKQTGLTRDWEVILDHWPLDIFCFCFMLMFMWQIHASAYMQGIMGDRGWASASAWSIFPWIVHWGSLGAKSGVNVSVFQEVIHRRLINSDKRNDLPANVAKFGLWVQPAAHMIAPYSRATQLDLFTFHSSSVLVLVSFIFFFTVAEPLVSILVLGFSHETQQFIA